MEPKTSKVIQQSIKDFYRQSGYEIYNYLIFSFKDDAIYGLWILNTTLIKGRLKIKLKHTWKPKNI